MKSNFSLENLALTSSHFKSSDLLGPSIYKKKIPLSETRRSLRITKSNNSLKTSKLSNKENEETKDLIFFSKRKLATYRKLKLQNETSKKVSVSSIKTLYNSKRVKTEPIEVNFH